MGYFIWLLPVLVNSSHVVLHAGISDKGFRAAVGRTPGDHVPVGTDLNVTKRRLTEQKVTLFFTPIRDLLVWFLTTVGELMSGQLVPSTKALVTAFTGEGFLL